MKTESLLRGPSGLSVTWNLLSTQIDSRAVSGVWAVMRGNFLPQVHAIPAEGLDRLPAPPRRRPDDH